VELAASFVAQACRSDTSSTGPEDLSSVEPPRSTSIGLATKQQTVTPVVSSRAITHL
jgi:hypothetical protein